MIAARCRARPAGRNGVRIEPLYFLLVEEDLQAERFLEGLKRAIVPPEWGPVGWERLSAAASSLPEILGAVRTPALFARPRVEGESASPDKLVVVEEAEKLPPSGWKELASSLREPLPGLCLAFVFRPERPRKWSPPLENTAAVVKKFFRLRGGKLEEWLDAEARGLELVLSREARAELIGLFGDDLRSLRRELEKLGLYLGGGGKAGSEEVRAVAGAAGEGSVFDLIDRIFSRRPDQALSLLRGHLRAGEAPLKILNLMARKVNELWLGREEWERTRSTEQACRAAKVAYYRPQFMRLVEKTPLASIPFMLRRLLEADLALKGGEKNPGLALERLVLDLAAPA